MKYPYSSGLCADQTRQLVVMLIHFSQKKATGIKLTPVIPGVLNILDGVAFALSLAGVKFCMIRAGVLIATAGTVALAGL